MSYVLAEYEMHGKMQVSAPQNAGLPDNQYFGNGMGRIKNIFLPMSYNPIEAKITLKGPVHHFSN